MVVPWVCASVTRKTVDQTVVSVGPNTFHTAPHEATRRRARSMAIASPPHSTVMPASPVHPASNSIHHVVGVAWTIVAPELRMRAARRAPSMASSREAITTSAPTIRGRNTSSTEMSNDSVASPSTTSPGARPGSCCIDSRKLTALRCSISTPLGMPVEPDV